MLAVEMPRTQRAAWPIPTVSTPPDVQARRSWASALLHPVEQLSFGSHAWHLLSPRAPANMLTPLGALHSAAAELRALLPWHAPQHGIDEDAPMVCVS